MILNVVLSSLFLLILFFSARVGRKQGLHLRLFPQFKDLEDSIKEEQAHVKKAGREDTGH